MWLRSFLRSAPGRQLSRGVDQASDVHCRRWVKGRAGLTVAVMMTIPIVGVGVA